MRSSGRSHSQPRDRDVGSGTEPIATGRVLAVAVGIDGDVVLSKFETPAGKRSRTLSASLAKSLLSPVGFI
jgi:hypothetical protein